MKINDINKALVLSNQLIKIDEQLKRLSGSVVQIKLKAEVYIDGYSSPTHLEINSNIKDDLRKIKNRLSEKRQETIKKLIDLGVEA